MSQQRRELDSFLYLFPPHPLHMSRESQQNHWSLACIICCRDGQAAQKDHDVIPITKVLGLYVCGKGPQSARWRCNESVIRLYAEILQQ